MTSSAARVNSNQGKTLVRNQKIDCRHLHRIEGGCCDKGNGNQCLQREDSVGIHNHGGRVQRGCCDVCACEEHLRSATYRAASDEKSPNCGLARIENHGLAYMNSKIKRTAWSDRRLTDQQPTHCDANVEISWRAGISAPSACAQYKCCRERRESHPKPMLANAQAWLPNLALSRFFQTFEHKCLSLFHCVSNARPNRSDDRQYLQRDTMPTQERRLRYQPMTVLRSHADFHCLHEW